MPIPGSAPPSRKADGCSGDGGFGWAFRVRKAAAVRLHASWDAIGVPTGEKVRYGCSQTGEQFTETVLFHGDVTTHRLWDHHV